MKCDRCGELVEGNAKFCSNCGKKMEIKEEILTNDKNTNKTSSGLSVASIVLGVAGILCGITIVFGIYGLIFSIVGLILGIIGKKRDNNIAGIILNAIGLFLTIIAVLIIAFFAFVINKVIDISNDDINGYVDSIIEKY